MARSFTGGFILCIAATTAMMSAHNWKGKGPTCGHSATNPVIACSATTASNRRRVFGILLYGDDGVFADSPDTTATSRILLWQASRAACLTFHE